MAKRAFKCTMLVLFDDDERDDVANEVEGTVPSTSEELMEYIKDAVIIDVNTEENGNPHGFCSAELLFEELKQLDEMEFLQRYDT